MHPLIYKLPFLAELIINGSFILGYSLKVADKLPPQLGPLSTALSLELLAKFVPFIVVLSALGNLIKIRDLEEFFRKYAFSVVVLIPLFITFGDLEFAFWLSSAHLLSSVLSLYEVGQKGQEGTNILRLRPSKLQLSPAQFVLLSFGAIILSGTFLFMLPISAQEGQTIKFIDAFFLSTSATCVTGLSTISVGKTLSLFGQIVLLVLIQIGGLGYMTLFSSMTILLGRSMSMEDRIIMQDMLEITSLEQLTLVIIDIIKYTFIIELWGGIVLTIAFTFEGFEFTKALYFGFFHSISAFCNAGFGLLDDSLESFATNPLVHGTVAVLITLGGLGFIVLRELKETVVNKRSLARLSLHSRTVLLVSLLLTVSAAFIIFFGEFLNALDGFTLWEKIQVSLFQAVTLRTAGFNTLSFPSLHSHTVYIMILYMFIGAAPGSTGGGIKVTTAAILFQSIKSTLTGRHSVELFDRKIPTSMVVKTTALSMLAIIMVGFFVFILIKVEKNQTFLSVLFESLSAFGTVGLSLGITPYLTVLGKLGIICLMFIGRVGPLTLVLAVGERTGKTGRYEYPEGRIMIG